MKSTANPMTIYDAAGRRTQNNAGTRSLYDGANSVQELSGGTPVSNRVTGGVDEFFSRSDSSGTYTPITDALGSTIALTNAGGAVTTSYTFDPFGNTSSSGAANSNTAQYTGRENDGNGLYYYRARYYHPTLGRFISQDPLGLRGGLNVYSYVFNSPVNRVDPTGRLTANLGGNISISIGGVNVFNYTGGIVIDSNLNVGVYNTIGAGLAVNTGLSGSLSLTGGGSSGRNICSFGGPFLEIGGNAGLGPGAGASGYTGFESDGKPILGGSVNAGIGAGAEIYDDITFTHVTPIFGRKTTCK